MRPSLQLVAAGCCLALVLTGCASDAPRAELIPPGPAVTSVEQLSGDYCYFSPDDNLRSFRRSPKMIPFVDVEAFGEPTKVSVEASAEQIVFTFTDGDGKAIRHVFAPSLFRAAWRENALVVPWREIRPNVAEMIAVNILGAFSNTSYIGGRERESRLFRLEDGQLIMTDTFRESGDLRKPTDQRPFYWDRRDSVALLLEPAADDCAAGPAHPPQQWFDEGVDVRKPECTARLEEQIVSILVAEGEAQEESRLAAEEKVTAISMGRGAWTGLSFTCSSGTTYVFRFGKQSSECVLQMVERKTKHGRRGWAWGHTSNRVRRPLPDCFCN